MQLADTTAALMPNSNPLEMYVFSIRKQNIDWLTYYKAQVISQDDYRVISEFDRLEGHARIKFMDKNRQELGKGISRLLDQLSETNVLQYLLILVDDMLEIDHERADIFREPSRRSRMFIYGQFFKLLNDADGITQHMAGKVIAKVACWGNELMNHNDLKYYFTWLIKQIKGQQKKFIHTIAICFQLMLRVEEYRATFVTIGGIPTLLNTLETKINFQAAYHILFSLWVLTFNTEVAERMHKFDAVPVMGNMLANAVQDKVIRMLLAIFRNLIERPEDKSIVSENAIAMVQNKVLKQLSILEQREWQDEDIAADIQFLTERLQASVQNLTSFEAYVAEVKSGRLEWSPVHRSAQFWRENAPRLNEKRYGLLRTLLHLINTSRDPLVLSVASFDIGEYARFYPQGKRVLSQFGVKPIIMQLLSHGDSNVRYEALLALQKIMVENWEYLLKPLFDEN